MNTPTLPDRFTFDLTLAKLGWPLVTRDGRKAEVLKWDHEGNYPLIGCATGNETWDAGCLSWTVNGHGTQCEVADCDDLFLSAYLTNPAVQKAVAAAHKAGEPIQYRPKPNGAWQEVTNPSFRGFSWMAFTYLPTRLLSQLTMHTRTRRLLPPEHRIAEGHNPDGLTVAQVGEGFECYDPRTGYTEGSEFYSIGDWLSSGGVSFTNSTYRRRIPAPAVPWSKPEHVPGPVCWLRWKAGKSLVEGELAEAMIVHVNQDSFYTLKQGYWWADAKAMEYSTDRKEWKECVC